MKKLKLLAAGLAACLISGSASAAVLFTSDRTAFEASNTITITEDFEGFGVAPSNILTIGDTATLGPLKFNLVSSSQNNVLLAMGTGFSGISGITGVGLTPNAFADNLEVVLASPVTAFGLDLMSQTTGTSVLVSLFDSANALIGSTSVLAGPATATFLGAVSDMGISRVLIDNGADGGPIIDNVVAGVAPVPLPAPALLLLSGFAGLAGISRSKRRKAA